MLDKFFEQTQAAMKPLNELVALNTKVMEEVFEKQKAFFDSMINDSMAYAKELSAQKDFSGVYQTQKSYLEGVQEKLVSASSDAYDFFTTTQEKAGEVIKSAMPS